MLRESNRLRPTVFASDLPPLDGKSARAARASGSSHTPGVSRMTRVSGRVLHVDVDERATRGSRGVH